MVAVIGIVLAAVLAEAVVLTQLPILGVVPALAIVTIVVLGARLRWHLMMTLTLLAGLIFSLLLADRRAVLLGFIVIAVVLGVWRWLYQGSHVEDIPVSGLHQASIVVLIIPLYFAVRYPLTSSASNVFEWLHYVGLCVALSLGIWGAMYLVTRRPADE